MKVLHLLASNSFSGAENVVCQIIQMTKNVKDLEMVYCSPNGNISDALKERDVKFVPLSKLSKKEVKRVIVSEKPDVVHAHDMHASFVASRACKKTPLVSHIHNNAFDSRKISVKSVAYLLAAKKAKAIIWVSKSAKDGYRFQKAIKDKSQVIYNILDVDALYQRLSLDNEDYDFDAIFLGRLTYPKNPQRLLGVFRLVADALPSAKFAVVGSGELDAEVKELCSSMYLDKNVTFFGFKSNPLKILKNSKVMVMTSRWEGTPMCALEASAVGTPIVSTCVDGLKDIITNGENGYMSDDDNQLAKFITDIILDQDKRFSMSKNMLDFSKQFNDTEKYTDKLISIYNSAIGE